MTGNAYEHKILDFIGVKHTDRQIRILLYRLRVNLDGEDEIIHEVKTHKSEEFKVTKAYWQQAQVEMFATGKELEIVAYKLEEEDYNNFFRPIDPDRITRHKIDYDPEWIEAEYIPRLKYFAYCLRKGVMPCAEGFVTYTTMLKRADKKSRSYSTLMKILGGVSITSRNVTLRLL